ncbi:MAG: sigma factor-like helix-turn-helix DNA-binding protein [bacterium]
MTNKAQIKDNIQLDIKKHIDDVLKTIDQEREKEIISRRFGLFDRKETLEQIGELLGITRERVRQLEKSIITKLRSKADRGELPNLDKFQAIILETLNTAGQLSRVTKLANELSKDATKIDQSRIAFLAELSPELTVVDENDFLYLAIGNSKVFTSASIKEGVSKIINSITKLAEPKSIKKIAVEANIDDYSQAEALASISKQLASLNDKWGLVKWPMVNPKNIRDKIYVILKENNKHMHFNEIADAIQKSDFKRKNVTTQAIHNELIKDKRFVLIGRGIYALREWGYKKGTVSDIISEVLRKEGKALHRDDIVKKVLESRYVKETTILLNLQGKNQFKRVAKATYELDESKLVSAE